MASLYPSLEDMKVDQIAKAQVSAVHGAQAAIADGVPAAAASSSLSLYSGLGLEELMTAAGLDIDMSDVSLQQQLGSETALAVRQQAQPIVSITGTQNVGVARAEIKQGVREVAIPKNQDGKFGMAVKSIDKGIFVSFVWQGSPAAMMGIRFGDQILAINDQAVAGWSTDKAMKVLKKVAEPQVTVAVRDRPFERTITAVKDHSNHIGFLFLRGTITHLVADTSAARNGILINHQLVEINGQNVVGLKDADIARIIQESPRSVTVTIMPKFIFDHLVKSIGSSTMKKYMDHSIPEI